MFEYLRAVKRHRDDRGASAVEYGLLIAAVAAIILTIAFALGSVLQSNFKDTCDRISSSSTAASETCNTSGTGD